MQKIKLRIKWSKKENDFKIFYPRKADGHWANHVFLSNRTELCLKTDPSQHLPEGAEIQEMEWKWHDSNPHFANRIYQEISYNLITQLTDRGFDPKTLKIEVSIDPKNLKTKFPHIYDDLSPEEKEKLSID
jgi:hypothetical protein